MEAKKIPGLGLHPELSDIVVFKYLKGFVYLGIFSSKIRYF